MRKPKNKQPAVILSILTTGMRRFEPERAIIVGEYGYTYGLAGA
ncbi:hypothetical protein [Sinomicrobium kalidii]|nr:hypothetical protein [Sinomicrobium kalidii]